MSEVELYLIKEGDNCTIYTLQFYGTYDRNR